MNIKSGGLVKHCWRVRPGSCWAGRSGAAADTTSSPGTSGPTTAWPRWAPAPSPASPAAEWPLQGIIGSDGARWQDHRRFALKHLKDFGFGKIGLEGVIQEEAEDIVKHLSSLGEGDCRWHGNISVTVDLCRYLCDLHVTEWARSSVCLWSTFCGLLWPGRGSNQRITRFREWWTFSTGLKTPFTIFNVHGLHATILYSASRLFKEKFALEYLFPWYGLVRYYTPGLDTRRRIITELRAMFRLSIQEHSASLDPLHPRYNTLWTWTKQMCGFLP